MKAKALIDAGAIGDPLTIRIKSNFGVGRTAWTIPPAAQAWRLDPAKNGGGPIVFDDGHHKFALAWHFMGMAEQVHAWIDRTEIAPGKVIDSPAFVSWKFAGGRYGNLEAVYSRELEIDTVHYAQDDRLEITGTRGVLWITRGHGKISDQPPVMLYADGEMRGFSDWRAAGRASFIESTRHHIDALLGRRAGAHRRARAPRSSASRWPRRNRPASGGRCRSCKEPWTGPWRSRSSASSRARTISARGRCGTSTRAGSTGSTAPAGASASRRSGGSTRARGKVENWSLDRDVGAMALRRDGGAVLALDDGFYFFDFASGRLDLIQLVDAEQPRTRLNDGKCDRRGRFYAGGMDDKEELAICGLYRLDPSLRVTKVDSGIICSNGPCWSPDDRTFYFADTFQGEYWAYDFDIATGSLANKRVFASFKDDAGVADGSTIDDEGCVWNAQLISGDLVRYAPDGIGRAAHRHAGAEHHELHVRRRAARRAVRHVDGAGEAPRGPRSLREGSRSPSSSPGACSR